MHHEHNKISTPIHEGLEIENAVFLLSTTQMGISQPERGKTRNERVGEGRLGVKKMETLAAGEKKANTCGR